MSMVLDTKRINEIGEIEATDGRFFVDKSSEYARNEGEFFMLSQGFYIQNCDLLRENAANLVLQADLDESQQLLKVGQGDRTITLVFDSQQLRVGEFRWGLTMTRPNLGRLETYLASTKRGTRAESRDFDAQGKLRKTTSVDPARTVNQIMGLIESDQFRTVIDNKREALAKAELDLSTFSVEALKKYSEARYEKLMAQKEHVINKIGFSITRSVQF